MRTTLAHRVRGRLRLRVEPDAPAPEVQHLLMVLRHAPGVTGVELRPRSASVVVRYRAADGAPDLGPELVARLRQDRRLELLEASEGDAGEALQAAEFEGPSRLARRVDESLAAVDRSLKRRTANAFDLADLLPLLTAATSVVTARKARSTPLWLTLLIFSFNSFVTLHQRRPLPPSARARQWQAGAG